MQRIRMNLMRVAVLFGAILFQALPVFSDVSGWMTPFEKNRKTTPRYQETMAFLHKLDAAYDTGRLTDFGTSPEGRALPLFVISTDKNFTPHEVEKSGKMVILIQGAIHSGESEGKDAILMLARDLLVHNKYPELTRAFVFLLVPIFNVDGHEQFSAFNRINQNGPLEMGWRVTATRLNLNRDFMKADAPEMRAWLKMYHAWKPHFFYDCHTTDGMDFQYALLCNMDEHAEFGGAVSQWTHEHFMPALYRRCAEKNMIIGPYAELIDEDHPEKGLMGGVWRPMLSNVFATVCNRGGFLIETHSLKPYDVRVQATYDIILMGLQEIARDPQVLHQAIKAEDAEVATWSDRADTLRIPLQFTTRTDRGDSMIFYGFKASMEKGLVSGAEYPVYSGEHENTPTIYYNQVDVKVAVTPPQGYLIPRAWRQIIDVLRAHDIPMQELSRDVTEKVHGYRFENVSFRAASYEGRLLPNYMVQEVTEKRSFPAGTYYVPLANTKARLIMHLLEPQAPDALVAWGLLNTIFEDREYFEPYIMEPLAQKMLAQDAELQKSFAQKLASDSVFAASPRARLRYFYQRSRYYDAEKNLYPIWRWVIRTDLPLKPVKTMDR